MFLDSYNLSIMNSAAANIVWVSLFCLRLSQAFYLLKKLHIDFHSAVLVLIPSNSIYEGSNSLCPHHLLDFLEIATLLRIRYISIKFYLGRYFRH